MNDLATPGTNSAPVGAGMFVNALQIAPCHTMRAGLSARPELA